MEKFYVTIFLVGVLYTLATSLLGGLFDFAHFDSDGQVGSHVDLQTGHVLSVSPIKPITIVAFITVFGGTGFLFTTYGFNPIIVFIIALILGILISFLLFKLVVIPLSRAENTSAVSQKTLIGLKATVISPILQNGFGLIEYEVSGSKHDAPAMHVKKEKIGLMEKVVIYEIKDNVFYVEPVNEEL